MAEMVLYLSGAGVPFVPVVLSGIVWTADIGGIRQRWFALDGYMATDKLNQFDKVVVTDGNGGRFEEVNP